MSDRKPELAKTLVQAPGDQISNVQASAWGFDSKLLAILMLASF